MKTAVLHTRIDPKLKTQAETVFEKIGLSSSDAIRIFYKQVVLRKGLPFDVSIPNKQTAAVLRESERNIGVKTFETPEDAFAEWDNL
ncbi:MAG: type II toxin-antitoxin system RelB/DinJ family antitoxin [Lentisphaerae bacterium]|jgi:DNA-damage-inducible protein J|nr:type II toxin-antitoxin system RelB/DinJ family antitoxin [Lentisphaerota bacterium]